MRELRHREVKDLAQGHTAMILNPGGLFPELVPLTIKYSCTDWKHGETRMPASGQSSGGGKK